MEDSLPPEDRLPREDACSMDEFNEFKKDMIKTIKESKVDEDAKYAV